MPRSNAITIVGGGLGGLIAAIECAERGLTVQLHEANAELGGRARSLDAPYRANYGPHALYADGPMWRWLRRRRLLPPTHRLRLWASRQRTGGKIVAVTPALWHAALRLPASAPKDADYRTWARERVGERASEAAIGLASLPTFDYDPGRLSAAFVQERFRRVSWRVTAVRYVLGGWSDLVARLTDHARLLGVRIETGSRIESLPEQPVIIATSLNAASKLLGRQLDWLGAQTVILDVGLCHARRWPSAVLDLDHRLYITRITSVNPSAAPRGHELLQASAGLRPEETIDAASARIEETLNDGFPGWQAAEVWRRRTLASNASGALDPPGANWRDRPPIEQGDGVYLVGDAVASPGMLSEVALNSAIRAAANAKAHSGRRNAAAASEVHV
jgi:phytoene dehydrogenase-like protein